MMAAPDRLKEQVEQHIDLLNLGQEPGELYEPIRYIMKLGGKRLRPLLTLLTYAMYRDDPEAVLDQAVAVEMFHNFTLVHDDIMDKAPIRRGNPTVHEKWNENIGILSGDVMLVSVYDLLLRRVEPSVGVEVIRAFNRAAILVCEGQQWDMNYEDEQVVSEGEYLHMIRLKTAELLAFSLQLGALLAGKKEEVGKLMDFGTYIGTGFQLKDDLLDAFGGDDFGKQVGGDIISRKKTYLTLRTLELADKADREKMLKWYHRENGFRDEVRVAGVLELYRKYDIEQSTEKLVNEYFDRGFRAFEAVEAPVDRKRVLKEFTEKLIHRTT